QERRGAVEEPLAPPGYALRPRALGYFGLGFCGLTLLMASDAHFALSVPLGLLSALLAGFGAMDFAGCFDVEATKRVEIEDAHAAKARGLQLLASGVVWLLALRVAVAGVLPLHAWLAPLLVTLTSC